MAYRGPKTVSQTKLVSEAYRAIGGVARNSIANRAIVGTLSWVEKKRETINTLGLVGADFWEGDATKHFSVENMGFSVKRGEAIQ